MLEPKNPRPPCATTKPIPTNPRSPSLTTLIRAHDENHHTLFHHDPSPWNQSTTSTPITTLQLRSATTPCQWHQRGDWGKLEWRILVLGLGNWNPQHQKVRPSALKQHVNRGRGGGESRNEQQHPQQKEYNLEQPYGENTSVGLWELHFREYQHSPYCGFCH